MEMVIAGSRFLTLFLCCLHWHGTVAVKQVPSSGTGFFWHITDMHWDPTYNDTVPGGSCGTGKPDGNRYGPYGDYLCDSPWPLINSSVHAMKAKKSDVDFIIWTGDDTPHNVDISKDYVADIISNLTQQFLDVFPDTILYPVLGNHDWYPKSQLPPGNDSFYDRIADIWAPWLTDPAANETFRKSGYYSVKVNDHILLIGLNTNLYYDSNKVTADDTLDPADQFQWLDDSLLNASSSGLKVILISHVPPGQFEKHATKHWFRPNFNQRFVNLLRQHSEVFGSLHFGHHHTDTFRLLYNDKGSAIGSFFVAPAVTPWETTLVGVMGGAGNNPGIRLVQYDRSTGEIQNILQYYLNLTQANLLDADEWKLAYDASKYYDVPDMRTTSLRALADSLWTDDGQFDKYYKANGLYYDVNEKWTPEYRTVHCCSINELEYDKYTACVQKHSVSPSAGNRTMPGVFWLLLTAVQLVMLGWWHRCSLRQAP